MRAEAGILQREWANLYGTVVRAVGPFGIERVIFLSPEAMQKVLVSDWLQYPRVCHYFQCSFIRSIDIGPIQPDFLRNVLGITTGYGLLTTTGDEHRMMRRSMNPAFSIASLTARKHISLQINSRSSNVFIHTETEMFYGPIHECVYAKNLFNIHN